MKKQYAAMNADGKMSWDNLDYSAEGGMVQTVPNTEDNSVVCRWSLRDKEAGIDEYVIAKFELGKLNRSDEIRLMAETLKLRYRDTIKDLLARDGNTVRFRFEPSEELFVKERISDPKAQATRAVDKMGDAEKLEFMKALAEKMGIELPS